MAGYNTLSKEQLNEELVKLKEEYAKILESDIVLICQEESREKTS